MTTSFIALLVLAIGAFLIGLGHLISGRPGQVCEIAGTVLCGCSVVFMLVGVTADGG